MKQLLFLLLIYSFASCTGVEIKTERNKSSGKLSPHYKTDSLPDGTYKYTPYLNPDKIDSSEIILDTITAVPDPFTVNRSSYSPSSIALVNKKFIFMTDHAYGMIRVNGKDIYLQAMNQISMSRGVEYTQNFAGNGFKVVLKVTPRIIEKRDSYEEGTIAISNAKYKMVLGVHGGY